MTKTYKIDLTGQKFGRLTVLEFVPSDGKSSKWKCKCECGNETVTSLAYLKSGDTKSCGCLLKDLAKKNIREVHKKIKFVKDKRYRDYDGLEKNGIKIVDFYGYNKTGDRRLYNCICTCGKIFQAVPNSILSGRLKSCGCRENYKSIIVDRVGDRVGILTCIAFKEIKNGQSHWLCRCDCGNETIVSQANLKENHIYSCGCIKESKIYKKVKSLLSDNIIKCEYKDHNCKHKFKLSFDLYVDDSFIIEVDGLQHFKEDKKNVYLRNYKSNFTRDMTKNNYCINNNIPLIRIPYYLINIVSKEDLDPSTSIWLIKNHDDIMNYYELEIEYRNKSNKQDFFDKLNEIKESKKGEKNGCKTSI